MVFSLAFIGKSVNGLRSLKEKQAKLAKSYTFNP